MDDSIKQELLTRFSLWLDAAPDEPEDEDALPDEVLPRTDLYSLFVEMAGLRSEVRAESRLMKDALDQFRGVFDTLQASHATLRQELERVRTETKDQSRAAIRPLLLDMIDLRDRLLAALAMSGAGRRATPARWWRARFFPPRDDASGGDAWREGLRLTLGRLDQMLLDRQVVPLRLAGQPFDPRQARVVATVTDSAAPDGIVIEEVRAGFLWHDQVLRSAEVTVSKSSAQPGEPT